MKTILITAMDECRGIGKDNKIPWHIRDEFRHFQSTTKGHIVMMGRKTADSIKEYGTFPLKYRTNLVVTRNHKSDYPGESGNFFECLGMAMCYNKIFPGSKLYLCGGWEVYNEALGFKLPDEILVSRIPGDFDCDTHFDYKFEDNADWVKRETTHKKEFKIERWVRQER